MHSSNYHIRLTGFLLFSISIILCCSPHEKITDSNYQSVKIPPGGVRIANNFFCDATELENLAWLEYIYWTARVFGSTSPEYLATLPDTLVWLKPYNCLESYSELYLRHPVYLYLPVVGITQQQAIAYSKWRSDRVFEGLLISLNKVELFPGQDRETYFSIEKYFNGTYTKMLPGEKVKYYPGYRLPTPTEWKQLLNYADSVDKSYFEKCNSKYCKECRSGFPKFNSDVQPCVNDSFNVLPAKSGSAGCYSKKGDPVVNLRGNVGEWSSETDVAFGGSWNDQRERILLTDTFQIANPNSWTGFRNVCEWKEWKDEPILKTK